MPRRTRTRTGPQQNPRNLGQNRVASVRANNRTQNAFSTNQNFQGGLGQTPSMAPGAQPPRAPQPGGQPGGQQGAGQCPAGQKFGPTPDGRMGCVPDRQVGAPGASPARTPGAGTPNRTPKPSLREGY
jgi:hypothetical protein